MGCVPRVINFWAFGTLKSLLAHDTCHPVDWAICPLPTFLHMATYRVDRKTGHSRSEGGDRLVGSKTPEGRSIYRPSILEDTHRGIVDCG